MGKIVAEALVQRARRGDDKMVLKVGIVVVKGGGTKLKPYRLAGHVFAILADAKAAALIVRRIGNEYLPSCLTLPSWLTWRNYSLVKIGQAPFSKVVLRCQTVPPITDIIWEGLHP